jgi:hypothetical protein
MDYCFCINSKFTIRYIENCYIVLGESYIIHTFSKVLLTFILVKDGKGKEYGSCHNTVDAAVQCH